MGAHGMSKTHIWFRWPGHPVSKCISCDMEKAPDPGPCPGHPLLGPHADDDQHEPVMTQRQDAAPCG
jgi:hypothetical protein